ncbi:M48 family metalloprotease, partial [Acinetobacter baumannii]
NEGILHLLRDDELEGVIAHEIAHIKHRDTLTNAIVATLAGAVSSLGNLFFLQSLLGGNDEEGSPIGGLFAVLIAPIAATMVQMGVSRV